MTETWLKSYIEDAQLDLPGYNVFRCDRSVRVGGGVLLYTHEKLPITNFQTYDDKYCQALMCTCEISKSVICILYRPPDCPTLSFRTCLNFVEEYLNNVTEEFTLSLMGDFNLPLIDWNSNTVLSGGTSSQNDTMGLLLEFMNMQLCSQYVHLPTRLSNVLDLYVCNSDELITHVAVSDTSLSDHRMIEIFWSFNPCSIEHPLSPDFNDDSFRSIDFSKADYIKLSERIESVNWNDLWSSCSLEDFPELFTQTVLQICLTSCPKKTPPTGRNSSLVRIPSRRKRKLQKQLTEALETPGTSDSRISALQNKIALAHIDVRDAINEQLQNRENIAVEKIRENPKFFYSYAKKFSKKKGGISMLFDNHMKITSDSKQMADLLQRQFTSVFSDPTKTNLNSAAFPVPGKSSEFSDELLEFTVEDIVEAINEISINSAAGPDEIPASLIKNCKDAIAVPIHLMWSQSLAMGKVPSYYKFSHVFPLHKKDSKALPSNYRPISLTSHIIKVFERVVRKKLVNYLESNNFLCSRQHGFRAGRSCLTQLVHHLDDIIEALMNNNDFDTIYLDFSKAFDKVDHKLLIKKLHRYGVNPKLVKWIESFLTDRYQAVVVDGKQSFLSLILSGVPQGTVLGPILFLIFINDIEHCVSNAIIKCFADDTKVALPISSEDDVPKLQLDLDKIIKWSDDNNMALHKDKFQYLCHKCSKQYIMGELPFIAELYQYHVSPELSLSPINQVRDLGVLVSSDLSWSPHIRSIADKARRKAAWVLSVFHTRSRDTMLILYKTMVRSLLEYCSPLWNPQKICDIQELESVQKSYLSRISGLQHFHYWERLKELSLMSLQRRRERYIIIFMWKILNGKTSNDLNIEFVTRPRLGIVAKIPPVFKPSSAANKSLYDASFGVIGPRLWNIVPYHMNAITKLEQFKLALTKFVLSVPDLPPIRGYTTPNSNSLLCWRNDKEACTLWGGHHM